MSPLIYFFKKIILCVHFIFSLDVRGKSISRGVHWANEDIFTGRASMSLGEHLEGDLVLDPVEESDEAMYGCRVDFLLSPTHYSRANLTVIGECYSKSLRRASRPTNNTRVTQSYLVCI